jgi:DNA-binding transcriptional LysR family regulator
MFERIERERLRWYIAFSGSSLHNVMVAVEAGLGLSLLPRNATTGYRVRQYAPFGMEPPMVVSIYAWDSAGVVSDLVERMGAVLAARCAPPK